MGRDRRRYARVGVALDCILDVPSGWWRGTTVDLSPYGVKVALPPTLAPPSPGTTVEARLRLPDGGPPVSVPASVVRADADGLAISFPDPDSGAFARLGRVVDLLLARLSSGGVDPDLNVRPSRDRRRAPRVEVRLDVNFDGERPRYWQGKTLNLSARGVKLALPTTTVQPQWGSALRLRLSGPDGEPPLSLQGIVWRHEPTGTALFFVQMDPDQLRRLHALVDSLGSGLNN